MKIVFFGTSNVALPILETLSKHHEISAVVTMPDARVGRNQTLTESPVSVLAGEMKLPILKPVKAKGNVEFYQELQNLTSPSPNPSSQGRGNIGVGVDLFVVVSYGQILPLEIINLPKFKTINVHFSLLPTYRGPSPIQSAILNGETETGASIFILDEQVDHGPILAQEKITIDDDDNSLTLSQKMAFRSGQLIIPTIDGFVAGSIIPKPQNDAQATHTEFIDKAHGKIDWSKSAQQIYNQFRAFYPWPGVWTKWEGKILKILDCNLSPAPPLMTGGINGGVVLSGGVVVCGDLTYLQINTLQLEGKNETKISDFLNGYPKFVGSTFV